MIRIVENNDWVVWALLLLGAVYLVMFQWLQRGVSLFDFFKQNYQEAQNLFLCWVIVSVGAGVLLSVLLSQYIPIVPRFVQEICWEGYTPNKLGFMLGSVLVYSFVKNILTAIFYQSIKQGKKYMRLIFVAQKFYFFLSLLLVAIVLVHYYFPIDRQEAYPYYLVFILLSLLGKMILYTFHKEQVLPKEWYYKILYICTLQILPLLAVWKFIFL